MEEKLILVSNDDGYMAPGVHQLTKLLSRFGRVVAVCPETPQSAKSMAITVSAPLRLTRLHDYDADEPGVEWYCVNGTPADCVKLAMHTVLGERRPDAVFTGINHGSNASVNVLYSGTMGAAFEGATFGIPSCGFSLCDHAMDADFAPMLPYVEKVAMAVLENGLPNGICLNVNAPNIPDLKGMRLTRACAGHWSDEYKEYVDPNGKKFYWITGKFVNEEPDSPDNDQSLLDAGYVTVVPVALDATVAMPELGAMLGS